MRDDDRFLSLMIKWILGTALIMSLGTNVFLGQMIDTRNSVVETLSSKVELLESQAAGERKMMTTYYDAYQKEYMTNKFVCGLCNTPEECAKPK